MPTNIVWLETRENFAEDEDEDYGLTDNIIFVHFGTDGTDGGDDEAA